MKQQLTVTPGDKLCVEEEFVPHTGAYVDNGVVRSLIVGRPIYDIISRRVYVKPAKSVQMPKSGDVLLGVVEQMRDEVAIIRFIGYDINKPLKHEFRGVLHISQATEARIQSLYDAIRLGDVVRIKVLNSYIPFIVTMKDAKLGVIAAYCSKCGAPLIKEREILKCRVCGNAEMRKLTPDYIFK
jgi:Predicted RNA-binding protein (consists of S1 domain and a Zn-ribbon domain)|uniref:Exosome complex component Csl4 n=1 Tax=Ignisphaera aggregans TaxID=334771 RepID=A0A7J2TB18_9CREN